MKSTTIPESRLQTPPASASAPKVQRQTLFITHAAPQDNEVALWFSAKLTLAGYHVWVDRRRLMGGDDSWDEIDRVLRNEAVKQIVVFTSHVAKPGVKKELSIGDVMRNRLSDPGFMIPIRLSDISYADAPPEFLRTNILDGSPNWHDGLAALLETLEKANVHRASTPDSLVLETILAAREAGRRFVQDRTESLLTNWFAINPPERVRYYKFEGLQEQTKAWLSDCALPTVPLGRLAGSFADPKAFAEAGPFPQTIDTAYDLDFRAFARGEVLGPYVERGPATRDLSNLLRQHFGQLAQARGLRPIAFANKETGWYFPDSLLERNQIAFDAPDGRRVRRTVTGKFKKLRWHLCLIAKPRLTPDPVYRIHGNVVLSDGGTMLDGDKTHARRRRLTRSWWNDVWRDRLLVAMHFLADGKAAIKATAGEVVFSVAAWPVTVEHPVAYEADDPPLPSEEDEDGDIVPSAALDDAFDETDADDDGDRPEDAR